VRTFVLIPGAGGMAWNWHRVTPLEASRPEVSGLVLVNAMIPVPGETAGARWDNTGEGRPRPQALADYLLAA
jgi:hypothetical protein